MGEVFKFPGGPNTHGGEGKKERINFSDKFVETVRFLSALMKSDQRSYNLANIAERRKGLEKHTDDDLRAEIMSGNRFKWEEKPSWYHAIIQEIAARKLVDDRK